ncbi:3-phosphoshikimate 1-carboxyvinyltransferase [Fictibacillus aquaticus]|uniref:3-phosphoshikimate 1-carboxyvinyltransferase n=1 Tax=Fictibacillus aquaticus TaxID=2021314 RepID=A0A235FD51_9BACL|nr:3-phosphoshikimate 1-carboxyvinyltransferase [Fictibacillus aquaticus]OYD59258.1 3-phosphoshikimate 1-carboxyvinyltransferase [Fictibacillus aquaticus]
MGSIQLTSAKNGLIGTVDVPGDKSISHRAVMFGSIAEGVTTVKGFLPGEDCLSTISCFQKLGVSIQRDEDSVTIEGKGIQGLQEPTEVLDVGNSGTTIRLMLGILSNTPFHSVIIGDSSIGKRPMKRVTGPLRQMGAVIDGREEGNLIPISIRGGRTKGIIHESAVASAQVKSAVLLSGLTAEGETTVKEPHKSRDHTERMLKDFGVITTSTENTVTIRSGQALKATHIQVPGDISSAAFFLVAGAIVPGSEITLTKVGMNPTRTGIIDALQAMGADITITNEVKDAGEPYADLIIKHSSLKGTEISGDLIPRLIDEIPVIALAATQAEGTTVIKDAAELKVKETNRIDTVVRQLAAMGADIEATDDGMIIHGKTPLNGTEADSFGDHRIGMMLAVASLIAGGETVINNSEAAAVSYPGFYDVLKKLEQ